MNNDTPKCAGCGTSLPMRSNRTEDKDGNTFCVDQRITKPTPKASCLKKFYKKRSQE